MAVTYPPVPVFPLGLDDDYTLFLVYNTAEADLTEDSEPWAEEVVVQPRGKTQTEVWADNGFANLGGELFYYDSVDKDVNGKVYRLKGCARNLGGNPTKFNKTGETVRGFVVAEHHNQLVSAVILVESFIGYTLTPDEETLDWRIRKLQAVPIITDDFGCPDVTFYFTVVSSDPSSGTVVDYHLDVQGSFNEFTLNFGDGSSTSSTQSGTHTYAPNAKIDPVVIFKNQNCQIVQTPPDRESVNAPDAQITPASYSAPNSPSFVFPNINIQSPSIPEANLTMPPFQFPCFDFSGFSAGQTQIPSIIVFQPAINLPSMITFDDISIPSIIEVNMPSILDINIPNIDINVPNIPNISLIVPPISIPPFPPFPPVPSISVVVPPFPPISVVVPSIPHIGVNWDDAPNLSVIWTPTPPLSITWGSPPVICVPPIDVNIDWSPVPEVAINWGTPPQVAINWATPPAVSMNWGSPPQVNVNWGSPPTVQVNVTVTCPSTPLALAAADSLTSDDMLGVGKDLQVEYDITGFPSEVRMIPPEIPDVRVVHDLPSEITVKTPTFPDLKLEIPDFNIKIAPPETQLTIEAIGIPESIRLESDFYIPERIELFTSINIPSRIVVEHDIPNVIRVEGLPDVVRLEHNLPASIRLEMPEKPEIELVYKGSPIPVQVELDIFKDMGEHEGLPCFKFVPCNK